MMKFAAGFILAVLISFIAGRPPRDPVIVALGDDMRCLGAYPSLADAKEMHPAAHTFVPVFPDWSHE